ncbi:MAG: PstS family phosphate ABC transporter substrate-binding protein [Leptolyngbyaceae cyanobacterium HOT.MB2.61]|nr:PstS family phosphate ABC transporter substrate-binding protein [Leptolyngbyaceae cyanobacterium HOT.MB2.61]
MVSNAMRFKLNRFSVVGAIAALATTVSLAIPGIVKSQAVVKIDGSSTVYPVTEAVAEEFQKQTGIKVTVGISGTGGGFKKFCRGETDISNASRPILQKEIDACKEKGIRYIELPVAFDALTVVINPQNTWAEKLTVAQLKKMWEPAAKGTITNWNQIDPSFPNAPLKLFGPGADSGTFDYFTEAIVGKSKSSRPDYTGSEDDNVLVQGVSSDKNALGYFGYAYYEENKGRLKAVAIDNGKGPVKPSIQTVLDGSYNPLSRPIFIYVNAESAKKPEVKSFVEFYMRNGEQLVKKVAYIPLPSKAYTTFLGYFRAGRAGSIFGGKEKVGLTIDQLMTMEAKQ